MTTGESEWVADLDDDFGITVMPVGGGEYELAPWDVSDAIRMAVGHGLRVTVLDGDLARVRVG